MRLFALGSQFGVPILAIHNAFRSRSAGKLLIENPLAVELLQPGTQQPGIFPENIQTLSNEFYNNVKRQMLSLSVRRRSRCPLKTKDCFAPFVYLAARFQFSDFRLGILVTLVRTAYKNCKKCRKHSEGKWLRS